MSSTRATFRPFKGRNTRRNVIFEDWLKKLKHKPPRVGSSWTRRWFTVEEDSEGDRFLCYYRRPAQSKPTAEIPFSAMEHVRKIQGIEAAAPVADATGLWRPHQMSKYSSLVFVIECRERDFVLVSGSLMKLERWLEVLPRGQARDLTDAEREERRRRDQERLEALAQEEGVMVAINGTVQGESGWYKDHDGTVFYFLVTADGEWVIDHDRTRQGLPSNATLYANDRSYAFEDDAAEASAAAAATDETAMEMDGTKAAVARVLPRQAAGAGGGLSPDGDDGYGDGDNSDDLFAARAAGAGGGGEYADAGFAGAYPPGSDDDAELPTPPAPPSLIRRGAVMRALAGTELGESGWYEDVVGRGEYFFLRTARGWELDERRTEAGRPRDERPPSESASASTRGRLGFEAAAEDDDDDRPADVGDAVEALALEDVASDEEEDDGAFRVRGRAEAKSPGPGHRRSQAALDFDPALDPDRLSRRLRDAAEGKAVEARAPPPVRARPRPAAATAASAGEAKAGESASVAAAASARRKTPAAEGKRADAPPPPPPAASSARGRSAPDRATSPDRPSRRGTGGAPPPPPPPPTAVRRSGSRRPREGAKGGGGAAAPPPPPPPPGAARGARRARGRSSKSKNAPPPPPPPPGAKGK